MQKCKYTLFSKNESGQVLVILVFVAVVIFLFGAVMINLGQVSCARIRLQNAVDAAALAIATYQARGLNALADLNEELALGRFQKGSTNRWEIRPIAMTGGNSGRDIGWHFNFIGDPPKSEVASRQALNDYLWLIYTTQSLQEAQVALHKGIIDRIGYLYLASNLGDLPISSLDIDKSEFEIGKEGLTRKKIKFHYAWEKYRQGRTEHWHKYITRKFKGWKDHSPCCKLAKWRYIYFSEKYRTAKFMGVISYNDDPEFGSNYLGTHHFSGNEGPFPVDAPSPEPDDTRGDGFWFRPMPVCVRQPRTGFLSHRQYLRLEAPDRPAWLEKASTPLYAQVSLTLPAQKVILGGKIFGITVPPVSAVARAEAYGGPGDKDGQMWNEYEKKAMLRYPNEGKPRAHFKARLIPVKGVSKVLH